MTIKKLISLCIFLAISTISLQATVYYLDYENGSNDNDGLSPASPWKDLFKIGASNPQPGDVYLFKRGSTWKGSQFYIPFYGTYNQPITFGAYGSTSDPLPVFTTIDILTGSADENSWSEVSPGQWTMPLASSPGRLWLDGQEVLRSETLNKLGIPDNEGVTGEWFHSAGTLHLLSSQNPALAFSEIEGSKFFYTSIIYGSRYLILENLDFQGGSGSALVLFGTIRTEIRNCNFGYRCQFRHAHNRFKYCRLQSPIGQHCCS